MYSIMKESSVQYVHYKEANMEQVQITPELYERVKELVLKEQREKAKAKAAERERRRKAVEEEQAKAQAMFEPTRRKYTPLLAQRYKNTFISGCRSLYDVVNVKFAEARNLALRTLGYWNVLDAYRDNKAEEANELVSEILDAMLKN